MITVVEGRPGQGKSVFLVAEILRYLRQGHHVYTNVQLKLPSRRVWSRKFKSYSLREYKGAERLHFIESLDDIVALREGKIVLDEVQTYLNSRNWDKLDIRFQLLLQQHRKRGLDILGATQSIKRADVVFRELVQVFYRINKLIVFKIPRMPFGLFYLVEYDPDSTEGTRTARERIGWFTPFVADPFTLGIYDTTQEYQIQSQVGTFITERYLITEKPTQIKMLVGREKS